MNTNELVLEKEDKHRLINLARQSESFREFVDNVGWEDWMSELSEAKEGEELSEQDVNRIDGVLLGLYEQARANEAESGKEQFEWPE